MDARGALLRRVAAERERMQADGHAIGGVGGPLVDRPVALRAQTVSDASEGSET